MTGVDWRHGTARHGTARHGTARHGTARHGPAPAGAGRRRSAPAPGNPVAAHTAR
nr:hypothetical protein OG999_09120 [Streptomyces sp. NBC_00886]